MFRGFAATALVVSVALAGCSRHAAAGPAAPAEGPCDDGNPCTTGDTYVGGVCTGTQRTCDPPAACKEPGTCNSSTGACVYPRSADGTSCDDGDRCSVGDACQEGSCQSGSPPVCDEPGVCHEPAGCDEATGSCIYAAVPDGTACDDGDLCSVADACQGGACKRGPPPACDMPDVCHAPAGCDETTGSCLYAPVPDGAHCDDGNACTLLDACTSGTCTPGKPVVCADGSQDAPAATCAEVQAAGATTSGTYWLLGADGTPYQAYCDLTTDGGGWVRVRTLVVPASVYSWASPTDIPYLTEVAEPPPHDRVMVKLTLDGKVSWVSWDARGAPLYLNFGTPLQGDLPGGHAGDGTGGVAVDLRIQDWSQCYSPDIASGLYQWGDLVALGAPCYGTFAFFDGARVLMALDRFVGSGALDLGIGPSPTGNPDWTFQLNAGNYASRILEWYVGSRSAAPDDCHAPTACDAATGSCGFASVENGTPCDDGDACTDGDTCRDGTCTGGASLCGQVNHVLITGQSLSTGAGSPILSDYQPYANLSFNTGVRAGGVGLTSFVPLVETWNGGEGETIGSGMANLATELVARSGGRPAPFLVSADGVSGQPYSALKRGTAAYQNGIAQIAAASNLAAAQGKGYAFRAVFTVHGETDAIYGNTQYEANLKEWQSDYEADVRSFTGQTDTVPLFLCQVSSWGILGLSTSGIPLAQLAASKDYPGSVILVGPKYFLPYSDGLHLTGDGERWLGEYYAKAYVQTFAEKKPWKPLQPGKVSRNGSTITVDFDVPVPPLVLDTKAVVDPGSLGFEYTDDSPAPPAIVKVKVASPTSVTIALASAPTGANRRIRYAYTATVGQRSGPVTGPRGNLRDSDATESLHGYSLTNWAVTFDEAVP